MAHTFYSYKIGSRVALMHRCNRYDPYVGTLGVVMGFEPSGYLRVKWDEVRYDAKQYGMYLPNELLEIA